MLSSLKVNEHTVIVDNISQSQTVSGIVWLPIGSRDEEASFRGVTHLLEHLISTENVKMKSFNDMVYEIGGRIQSITTPEYTLFGFTVSFENWQNVMKCLLHHLTNLHLSSDLIESERNVALSEKRSIDNDFKRKIHEMNIYDIFPKNSLSNSVLGSIEDINNISLETIKVYYEHYFIASNFSIVLSGNINIGDVEKFIEKNYFYFPNVYRENNERLVPALNFDERNKIVKHRKDTTDIYVLGSWVLPKLNPRQEICLSILNYYLGGGRNSYAYRKVRDANSVFGYESYSYRATFMDCAIWSIFTVIQKPKSIESIVAEIFSFVESGMNDFFANPSYINSISKSLLGSMSISLESTLMRANCIARYWHDKNVLFNFDDMKNDYSLISLKDMEYVYSLFKTSVISFIY